MDYDILIYLQLARSHLSADIYVLYGILLKIRGNSIERIAFPNEKTFGKQRFSQVMEVW